MRTGPGTTRPELVLEITEAATRPTPGRGRRSSRRCTRRGSGSASTGSAATPPRCARCGPSPRCVRSRSTPGSSRPAHRPHHRAAGARHGQRRARPRRPGRGRGRGDRRRGRAAAGSSAWTPCRDGGSARPPTLPKLARHAAHWSAVTAQVRRTAPGPVRSGDGAPTDRSRTGLDQVAGSWVPRHGPQRWVSLLLPVCGGVRADPPPDPRRTHALTRAPGGPTPPRCAASGTTSSPAGCSTRWWPAPTARRRSPTCSARRVRVPRAAPAALGRGQRPRPRLRQRPGGPAPVRPTPGSPGPPVVVGTDAGEEEIAALHERRPPTSRTTSRTARCSTSSAASPAVVPGPAVA